MGEENEVGAELVASPTEVVERAALVIWRAVEAGHSARDIARALADAGLLADERVKAGD